MSDSSIARNATLKATTRRTTTTMEQRELKFRLFDGERMIYDRAEIIFNYEWQHPHPVMQYTGLKDRNGIEIYEHDRVRYQAGNMLRDGVVEMAEGEWTVNYDNGARSTLRSQYPVIVVIGNIHENQ